MRLAIIGSRTATDLGLLDTSIRRYLGHHTENPLHARDGWVPRFAEIVSGGARGADRLAEEWVETFNEREKAHQQPIKLTVFKPDWDKHGKAAGFIRNEDIIGAADVVLAIWDGVSKGTQNSLSIAKRLKKTTIIVYV